jgi:hypothetical protein
LRKNWYVLQISENFLCSHDAILRFYYVVCFEMLGSCTFRSMHTRPHGHQTFPEPLKAPVISVAFPGPAPPRSTLFISPMSLHAPCSSARFNLDPTVDHHARNVVYVLDADRSRRPLSFRSAYVRSLCYRQLPGCSGLL